MRRNKDLKRVAESTSNDRAVEETDVHRQGARDGSEQYCQSSGELKKFKKDMLSDDLVQRGASTLLRCRTKNVKASVPHFQAAATGVRHVFIADARRVDAHVPGVLKRCIS